MKKRKCVYSRPKMLCSGIFELELSNIFFISEISNEKKIWRKKKCLNFWSNVPPLGMFEQEIHKTIVEFEVSTLKFFYLLNFTKTKSKFETKSTLFGYLCSRILKNYCIFKISTLKFVYLQKLGRKWKCLSFGTKVHYLGILGLEFYKIIFLFEVTILKVVYFQNFAKK